MTRTPEQIELAIKRLLSMRSEREHIRPVDGEDHVRLLIASCEAVALDAGIEALRAQLRPRETTAEVPWGVQL